MFCWKMATVLPTTMVSTAITASMLLQSTAREGKAIRNTRRKEAKAAALAATDM
jgi:hypothetical protein